MKSIHVSWVLFFSGLGLLFSTVASGLKSGQIDVQALLGAAGMIAGSFTPSILPGKP